MLNWFWWPTIGWGIGVLMHALGVFNRKSRSFQEEFEEWRRKRDRRRKRGDDYDDEDDDEDDDFGISRKLKGVHIIAGNKVITPKFEVRDYSKRDKRRSEDDDD